MKVTYSTNRMGPINMTWIKENGWNWVGGRIDVHGVDDPHESEIGLPIMDVEDWIGITNWLEGDWENPDSKCFRTETVWTLNQLVEEYEKTNPKITWWRKQDD